MIAQLNLFFVTLLDQALALSDSARKIAWPTSLLAQFSKLTGAGELFWSSIQSIEWA